MREINEARMRFFRFAADFDDHKRSSKIWRKRPSEIERDYRDFGTLIRSHVRPWTFFRKLDSDLLMTLAQTRSAKFLVLNERSSSRLYLIAKICARFGLLL